MTLVELTMLPPCPQIMLTHEQDAKFLVSQARWVQISSFVVQHCGGEMRGLTNQKK